MATTNSPVSLGIEKIFRESPLPVNIIFQEGATIPSVAAVEMWYNDVYQEDVEIVTDITDSVLSFEISVVQLRAAAVQRKPFIYVLLDGEYKMGNKLTISMDVGTYDPADVYVSLNGIGDVRVTYPGSIPLNGSVTPEKTTFFIPSKNLIDKEEMLIDNFGLDNSYNIVASTNNSLFKVPVLPSTQYTYYVDTTYPDAVKFRYETFAGVFISGYNASGLSFTRLPVTITTPANCYWLYVNGRTYWNSYNAHDTAQLQAGAIWSEYVPFGNVISPSLLDFSPAVQKSVFLPWKGKKVCFFGDSITARNWYQPLMQRIHQFTYVNDAVSGSCIATGKESEDGGGKVALVTRIPAVLATNSDLIFVYAGTNDWYYSVPIGALSDVVTTSFYGAVKKLVIDLQAGAGGKRVVMCTPIMRQNNRANYAAQKEYADVIKEICALYAMPVLDLFTESGMTYENINQFSHDNVHPNESNGSALLARQMTNFLFKV